VSILTGAVVVLRPATTADLDALAAIFATPEVAHWWHGYDRDRIEREVLHGDDVDETVYVIEHDGAVAGIIQSYEEQEPDYRSAAIDIAVGPAWHGGGVGVDAIRTLARHLIDARGHHRLTIDPATTNERAIAAYAKVGFRPVGVLRQHERAADGTWRDGLLMDLLADEVR
jgi:aminoglycoside 6'-N-acetyltransferase